MSFYETKRIVLYFLFKVSSDFFCSGFDLRAILSAKKF
ncbi:hypothetical protein LEP1GSC127_4454 [Leptospira kirschneri str. 200801925]|nr:hypothetical protein LEP1GSC127_4454 [Leptospira kirschneri str. 200801925]